MSPCSSPAGGSPARPNRIFSLWKRGPRWEGGWGGVGWGGVGWGGVGWGGGVGGVGGGGSSVIRRRGGQPLQTKQLFSACRTRASDTRRKQAARGVLPGRPAAPAPATAAPVRALLGLCENDGAPLAERLAAQRQQRRLLLRRRRSFKPHDLLCEQLGGRCFGVGGQPKGGRGGGRAREGGLRGDRVALGVPKAVPP